MSNPEISVNNRNTFIDYELIKNLWLVKYQKFKEMVDRFALGMYILGDRGHIAQDARSIQTVLHCNNGTGFSPIVIKRSRPSIYHF